MIFFNIIFITCVLPIYFSAAGVIFGPERSEGFKEASRCITGHPIWYEPFAHKNSNKSFKVIVRGTCCVQIFENFDYCGQSQLLKPSVEFNISEFPTDELWYPIKLTRFYSMKVGDCKDFNVESKI